MGGVRGKCHATSWRRTWSRNLLKYRQSNQIIFWLFSRTYSLVTTTVMSRAVRLYM